MPSDGPLADFGAVWLGWDIVKGRDVPQLDVPGLHDITMTPRKYGFHGTLKPPFHLTEGCTLDRLDAAARDAAAKCAPAVCNGLALRTLGHFLALIPVGDTTSLQAIAEACVRDLDACRAAPTPSEFARRRQTGLTERQETLLTNWGYPYVLEEFQFHLTLSGKLAGDVIPDWQETIARHLPELPCPFVVDQISLCGERSDGRFELIHRYTLTG